MQVKPILKSRWAQGAGATVAVIWIGVSLLPSLDPMPSHQSTEAQYHSAVQADFAGESLQARPMVAMAGRAASPKMAASAPAPVERRIQETQSFSYGAHREEIETLYDLAVSACGFDTCEVLNANLERHDRMLYAQLAMRIEPEALPAYLSAVEAGGDSLQLTRHERSATDRTMQYEDTTARLRSQTALRDRLLKLLASDTTKKTADILEIEREIARTQAEIESLQAQVRGIEAVTDRMTVNLSFRSDAIPTPPVEPPYLSNAIQEWKGIFLRNAAILIRISAGVMPLLVLSAGIGGTVLFIRRMRRRLKARREAQAAS